MNIKLMCTFKSENEVEKEEEHAYVYFRRKHLLIYAKRLTFAMSLQEVAQFLKRLSCHF